MTVKNINRFYFRVVLLFLVCLLITDHIKAQCSTNAFFKNSTRINTTGSYLPFGSVEDFNGDNKPDLSGPGSADTFVVRLNDGTGNFGNPVTTVGAGYGDFVVGDFNGDHKKDVIIRINTNPISLKTFTGDGTGALTPWNTTTFSQFGTFSQKKVKFNSDPRPQILAGNFYYSVNPDGTLAPGNQLDLPINNDDTRVQLGDFNGDGITDYVYTGLDNGTRTLILALNQGNATFTESPLNEDLKAIGVANLNDDGKDDILTTQFDYGNRYLIAFLSTASGNFQRITTSTLNGVGSAYIHLGDFNGDGKKDVLGRSYDAVAQIERYTLYFGTGTGFVNETTVSGKAPKINELSADFDGDGRTDFLEVGYSPYFPVSHALIRKNVCTRPGQTGIVDFNGDEINDLALWRPSDGRWSFKNDFYSAQGAQVFWGGGSLGDLPVPGDYDGDGKTDVAVWRNTNGYWYIRRSSDLAAQYLQWGTTGDKPVQGDYDGDGLMDAAVYRPSTGVWYIRQSSTGQLSAAQFGVAEDKPVQADYDGDGKTDLAVYRPSTGFWYSLASSTGVFTGQQFGLSTDHPVPGDYDADGRADLAVFRPAGGVWYLKSSFTGGFTGFQFGISTDVPVWFNTRNQSTTQAAVYRPSVGRWYVNSGFAFNNERDFGEAEEIPVTNFIRQSQ